MATFNPPTWLRNAHLQTILNSLGPKRLRAARIAAALDTTQLQLAAVDGTLLVGEFDRSPDPRNAVVILLHGWEGSSKSAYQLTTAQMLLNLGFDVLRLNLRDHGDSHHLNRELFNSTRSPEVAGAIGNFLGQHDYGDVFLGGYSLGGNFALRIAADHGRDLGVKAVVAICPPVDPANAMAALNTGWFVYEKYFFQRWARSLRAKLIHFPDLGYGDDLAGAKTIDDLNHFFVPRYTPYPDVGSYFAAYALTGNRLVNLAMPAWLIAAADDPIIPVSDIGNIEPNANLHVELQAYGGHCGFMDNIQGDSWAEKRLAEIFLSFVSG
ncbi:MAG: hypothetical protein VR73_14115 [Gammaproteobacteria bacterium BRH_c0]|nr:MAG: hypothetical protein VR73_14115 [Gammaproteobacteria bacterium BRH_c0]